MNAYQDDVAATDAEVMVTCRVWHVDCYYTEDGDRDVQREHSAEYTETLSEYATFGDDARQEFLDAVVNIFTSEGVEFSATNAGWASLPSGSYCIDLTDDLRREVSVHFVNEENIPQWVMDYVTEKVG